MSRKKRHKSEKKINIVPRKILFEEETGDKFRCAEGNFRARASHSLHARIRFPICEGVPSQALRAFRGAAISTR
jgi:hypothetical protein